MCNYCSGACSYSSCSCCYRCSVLTAIIIATLLWTSFILSETLPKNVSGKSVIFEDSIILLAITNPFWYSSVHIDKTQDKQDHLVQVYVVECDGVVVEKQVLQFNRTLTVDENVILLDPTFLVEGSTIDFNISILENLDHIQDSTIVISGDIHSIDDFKRNLTTSNTGIYYAENITSTKMNSFSYRTQDTGYYYIGFKPAGRLTFWSNYTIHEYKYTRPSSGPLCSMQESDSSCDVPLPTTLTEFNSDYYCVLCELISDPYFADKNSIDLDYRVHRSVWNMVTIAVLSLSSLVTFCGLTMNVYWCVRFKVRKHRAGYESIQ